MRRLIRSALLFTVHLSLFTGAFAQDWGATAIISSTMGTNANRLCAAEASRGDLGCPTYAPSLTTAGDISVTGNLSAQKFIGDGSGLTALTAEPSDRIISGTSGVFVSNTGVISLYTSGTNAGYFNALGLVTNGVSTTGRISASTLYATNSVYTAGININTNTVNNPSNLLRIGGNNTTGIEIQGSRGAGDLLSTKVDFYNAGNRITAISTFTGTTTATGALAFSTADVSGTAERMRIDQNGLVGIGTTTPGSLLTVSGTTTTTRLKLATNDLSTCDSTAYGTIKLINGRPYICRNTP